MQIFQYVAKDWSGETSEGRLSAVDRSEALEKLRAQDLFVISIKEQSAAQRMGLSMKGFSFKLGGSKPKSRDFMVFCRQFTTMLQAGINVLQVLKTLAEQSENEALREKLGEITLDVERGSDLAGAMKRHGDFFPEIITSMVEVGEAGGLLDTVMDRLADHFERQHDLEAKIRSATTYPLVISVFAVGVLFMMMFFVLPRFATMFEPMGIEMPALTRVLLGFADLITQFWYIAIVLLILLIYLGRRYLKSDEGRLVTDRFSLRAPVFGPIYTKMLTARFTRTLATLLSSGVTLVSALELTEAVVGNRVLSEVLAKTGQAIRRGQNVSQPLGESGVFPPMMVRMVDIGEESGSLDEMLSRTADFYESDVTYFLDRLATIIEPLLLVFIGIIVALLLLSIFTPLLKMYQSF